MDALFNRYAHVLMLLIGASLMLAGCGNEGCTDPQALNFDSIANKDDGSCIYCHVPEERFIALPVIDEVSFTVFRDQQVGTMHAKQSYAPFQFAACGGTTCMLEFQIENFTNKTMDITFMVSYQSTSFTRNAVIPTSEMSETFTFSFSTGTCEEVNSVNTGIFVNSVSYL